MTAPPTFYILKIPNFTDHVLCSLFSHVSQYYQSWYHKTLLQGNICEDFSFKLTREDASLLVPLMLPRLSFLTLINSSWKHTFYFSRTCTTFLTRRCI